VSDCTLVKTFTRTLVLVDRQEEYTDKLCGSLGTLCCNLYGRQHLLWTPMLWTPSLACWDKSLTTLSTC